MLVGLVDKGEDERERLLDFVAAAEIGVDAEADGIGDIDIIGIDGFVEFANEEGFFRGLGEKGVDGVEMGAGHCENVRRFFDQFFGERLAPVAGNIDAPAAEDLHGVEAGRLAVNGGEAGGPDLDVTAALDHLTEEAFRHGAAANVASADEEDVFHGELGTVAALCSQINENQRNLGFRSWHLGFSCGRGEEDFTESGNQELLNMETASGRAVTTSQNTAKDTMARKYE